MIEFPFPFRLDDGITGGPYPRELHLKLGAAVHLPRIILVVCAALGIGLWLVGLATPESPESAAQAGRMTSECAERDLKVTTLIEVQADAPAVPASVLGAGGPAQPDGRPTCLSDRLAEASAN